eukprot:symbB.v1.2.022829.t1/scaffold2043.1/size110972/3
MTMATNVTAMPPHRAQECMVEPRTEEAPIPSTPATCTPEHLEASEEEDVKLPSVGSARHGHGNCLPCAWFWKPQGCLNGDACLRCHLCPAGELKRRKGEQKAKRALAKNESSPESQQLEDAPPPAVELPSVGSRLHAAGQCKPCAWFWKAGKFLSRMDGPPLWHMGGDEKDADGCRNGQSCGHCHLCPAGEAKARKQAKVAAIRAKGESETELGAGATGTVVVPPQPVVYQAVLPQYPTLLTPWRGAPSPCASCTCVPVRPITSVAVPTPCYAYLNVSPCEAGDRRTVQELQVPTFAVPKTLPKVVQGPQGPPGSFAAIALPSKGSALHADGRCSPCAWFWKPQGCHHGAECGRCHLCPATEINMRSSCVEKPRRWQKTQ